MTSEAQDGVSGIPEDREEVEGSAISSQPPVGGGAASDAPPPSEPSVIGGGGVGGDAGSPTKQLSGDMSVVGRGDQSVKDSDVKASLDSLRKAGGIKGEGRCLLGMWKRSILVPLPLLPLPLPLPICSTDTSSYPILQNGNGQSLPHP